MDEARSESDIDNMQVAYDRALKQMEEHLNGTITAPALFSLVSAIMDKMGEAAPALGLGAAISDNIQSALLCGVVQAFFTGQEWGKSGRELYTVPAHEACNDPSHDHHVSRLN